METQDPMQYSHITFSSIDLSMSTNNHIQPSIIEINNVKIWRIIDGFFQDNDVTLDETQEADESPPQVPTRVSLENYHENILQYVENTTA